ncbi:MAG TPA: hypothetical protein VFQ85_10610 [Mycobacteriales bacterium]|jgi:hypothetical protein|nr:hypothetical protein [Mycobacteriales bacterium]
MIRRAFWTSLGIGLGATAGVLVARQLRRTREALTPSGIAGAFAGAMSGLTDAIRDFGADVRAGMAEREAELNDALGFEGDPYPDEVPR